MAEIDDGTGTVNGRWWMAEFLSLESRGDYFQCLRERRRMTSEKIYSLTHPPTDSYTDCHMGCELTHTLFTWGQLGPRTLFVGPRRLFIVVLLLLILLILLILFLLLLKFLLLVVSSFSLLVALLAALAVCAFRSSEHDVLVSHQVIAAEGEHKAARALKEASAIMEESSSALQLRYLQTLNTISAEKNSTIIFPLPIEFLSQFMREKPEKKVKPVE